MALSKTDLQMLLHGHKMYLFVAVNYIRIALFIYYDYYYSMYCVLKLNLFTIMNYYFLLCHLIILINVQCFKVLLKLQFLAALMMCTY